MKARWILSAPVLLGCSLLFFPLSLSSQRPTTPGSLYITSDPAGAAIAIDGQNTGMTTPMKFGVSPGDHFVSLTSKDLPNCKNPPKKVTVSSGQITPVVCDKAGWKDPSSK